ncbi:MAG: LAGLIDADG family homing endonuclease, partial [Halosimplex sp.]
VENNHPLAPASYTVEWWAHEFDDAGADVQAMRDSLDVDLSDPSAQEALEWADEYDAPLHPKYTYCWHDLSVDEVCALADAVDEGRIAQTDGASETRSVSKASGESEVRGTSDASGDGGPASDDPRAVVRNPDDGDGDPGGAAETQHDAATDGHDRDAGAAAAGDLVIPRSETVRRAVEHLLVEHTQTDDTLVVPDWRPLVRTLGFDDSLERDWTPEDLSERARTYGGGEASDAQLESSAASTEDGANAIEAVNEIAPFPVRERAPTRIGNRMGRPEKSEKRDLSPAVHTLFPIGDAGGSQRKVGDAAVAGDSYDDSQGKVEVEVGRQECTECGTRTYKPRCPDCGGVCEAVYVCPDCDHEVEPDESGRAECSRCETLARPTQTTVVDVNSEFKSALANLNERPTAYDALKAVKGLSSEQKTPEPMEKGILRAKHGVSAFKDGTVRYDMTDLPVTAVRPSELDVTADAFRALGYGEDIHGQPLNHDDQLVELNVQDVVLSEGAAEHMLKTADFVDDLLESYYGLEPFYELEERDDLVGELVFGMAPHTSAATVGRIVGFTTAAVGYAHPYFHAAKRRNCFHPETKVWYEDGAGEWRHEPIARLVEDRLDDPETDDFGALVEELDGEIRVPSLTADGREVVKPVEAVSKHPSPDHLVRVVTEEGRSLTVTPDHSMIRWDGRKEEIEAHDLSAGDELPRFGGSPEGIGADTASSATVVDGGSPNVEVVERVEYVPTDVDHTYCLTVADTHSLVANGLHAAQCDGDEDCVMLLMDGLLNFSRQYLPDQRGGSVAEDSRLVAVDPNGDVRFMTFDEFWDELESPVETDGKFRKRTCYAEGWQTYAFDESHEASLKPIEKAIRYRADDEEELLRIETQFGRSLDITEHHSLFRYDDGIEEVAGADLRAGDLVVAPRELDVEPKRTTIDVAECVDDPYVVIDDHVEDLLRTAWESTDHGSDAHEEFKSGLSYRLSKRKIPYERFERILDAAGFAVPNDVAIGLTGSEMGITRTIEVDENLAWFLGLFVAEGTTSSVNPCIHNADEELIDRAAEIATEKFGVEPGRRWSNRAYELRFPAVFREVLYALGFEDADSYDSSEKLVPECILRAPRAVAIEFLRGFVAGDGSDKTDDNVTTIAFYTTSDDVKDGIVFLLHRLGLVANVSEQTERDGNRQDIYTVTVSGGAEDNPLHRILDGEETYQPKSLVVSIPDALMDIREMDIEGVKQTIPKYLLRRDNVSLEKLGEMVDALDERAPPPEAEAKLDEIRPLVDGDLSYLRVTNVDRVDYDGYLYDLQVGGDPVFTANWLYAHNSMDAPLVMSSRIDPAEIDDEAHNVDIMREYPKEFYEATRELADPEDVEDVMTIAEETLGTDEEYTGFDHTHDTTNIAAGPDLSAYKTLGSMEEKMDAQLALSRKIRAVDETDVAERIIEYHFLPDLIGNLRAFSRQDVRCLDCGEKYRRMPLSGDCRECGGRVNLTVHEGSVNKYIETATRVAEEFGCRTYTKQRLEVLERSINRVFEDDTNKQSGIADFM